MLKTNQIVLAFAYVVSLLFLLFFVERSQFLLLISVFTVGFVSYAQSLKNVPSLSLLITLFAITRVASFFVLPHLSDDYYRFLWDGMLTVSGGNPYLNVPSNEVLDELPIHARTWLETMNSPNYYSVYPAFLQWIFATMYWIGGSNELLGINVFRSFVLVLECFAFWLASKSVTNTGKRLYACLPWLLLNPLYVLETFGNLHAEALVVLLLLLAYLLFEKKKLIYSASLYCLAAATKLLPLIAVPLIIRKLTIKQLIVFGVTSVILLAVISYRFIELAWISNQLNSISLYFKNFEFNASVYFLVRWIGFRFVGYNTIQTIGTVTPFVVLFVTFYLQWFKKWRTYQVLKPLYYSVFIYFILSSVVHPWYAIYLIFPAVIVNSSAGLFWSFLIMFSYVFYQVGDGTIYYLIITAEYTLLFFAFIFEKRLNRWFNFRQSISF